VILKEKKLKLVSNVLFIYYQVSLRIIWHLIIYKNNKKIKRYNHMWYTRRSSKIPFNRVVENTVAFFFCWCDMCQRWRDDLLLNCFFFLFFLSFLENYSLTLFVIDISTLVLIFLIFLIFILGLFIEVLFVFNFIFQSQFIMYYFFQFDSYSFDFLSLLLNWFLFSISICLFVLFWSFFFFYLNWIFFLISPFNQK